MIRLRLSFQHNGKIDLSPSKAMEDPTTST